MPRGERGKSVKTKSLILLRCDEIRVSFILAPMSDEIKTVNSQSAVETGAAAP